MTAQTIETPARTTVWTMPAGLTAAEELAYRKGYGRAAAKYLPPSVVNVKPYAEQTGAERRMISRTLAGTMVAHHNLRHPIAHKAGMSAVRSWIRKYDADPASRLANLVDPLATSKPRTTRAQKAKPAAAETPQTRAHAIGEAHKLDTVPDDWTAARAARKAARRDLAAALRTAGIDPRGDAWTAATTAAGLAPVEAVTA